MHRGDDFATRRTPVTRPAAPLTSASPVPAGRPASPSLRDFPDEPAPPAALESLGYLSSDLAPWDRMSR